eukprot:scaffold167325_cov31-Attheya_sp.AAC.1
MYRVFQVPPLHSLEPSSIVGRRSVCRPSRTGVRTYRKGAEAQELRKRALSFASGPGRGRSDRWTDDG